MTPMSAKQISRREIRKIVDMAIKESMPEFANMVRSVLDERQPAGASGTNQDAYGPAHQARIMKLVEDAYADMDHARQVYCSDDDEDGLILVIIHDDEDFGRAFWEACARARRLEVALPDTYIEPHILHTSEAEPGHTSGTRIVFENPMTLLPKERVLLIINDNSVAGRMRIQEYGFLLHRQLGQELSALEKKYGVPFYNDWKPSYYGPYSECLENDIRTGIDDKTLEKHDKDGSENRYDQYRLSAVGRHKWLQILRANAREMISIGDKIRFLQVTPTDKLLQHVYTEYPEYTTSSR